MQYVTEVVIFKLNNDADRTQFLAAAQATFDVLAGYEGYISRQLSESAEGVWVDVVYWRDLPSALAAADVLMSDPIGQHFGSFIDFASTIMHHAMPQISSQATKA